MVEGRVASPDKAPLPFYSLSGNRLSRAHGPKETGNDALRLEASAPDVREVVRTNRGGERCRHMGEA